MYRRSSDPNSSQLISFCLPPSPTRPSLLPNIPLPLPYLPSDYLPSSSSPKHIVISPASTNNNNKGNINNSSNNGNNNRYNKSLPYRQRSHSINSYLLGSSTLYNNNNNNNNDNNNNTYSDNNTQQTQSLSDKNNTVTTNQSFQLVPYREWTVILRSDASGSMVLYNQESRRISVQRTLPSLTTESPFPSSTSLHSSVDENIDECPLCHRPYPKNDPTVNNEPNYMDRNYFRLLETAPIDSTATSENNSPRTTSGSVPQTYDELFVDPSTSSANPSISIPKHKLNENAINQGYYSKFFIELRKLGRGFRGSVYLCEHILDDVKLGKYAVKKVAIGNNHTWLVKMLREVHLLERLHHPNIVSYKHSWLEYDRLTSFGPKVPCLFILMECANGGNLEEYLEPEITTEDQQTEIKKTDTKKSAKELKRERIKRKLQQQEEYESELDNTKKPMVTQKRLLSMGEISSLFLDIVQGLAHLHEQNIVHRDLKPPNLLLKWDDRRRSSEVFKIPRVLISDFGECEDLEGTPDSNRTGATGTMEFMAPEHVRLDACGRHMLEYSPKADMWSLGMVLYYLCYSRLPYSNVNDIDILREEILSFKEIKFPNSRLGIFEDSEDPSIIAMMETMRRKQATDIPQEFKILIRLLLSTDPAKRPSCQEILSILTQNKFDYQQDSPITTSDWKFNNKHNSDNIKKVNITNANNNTNNKNENKNQPKLSTSAPTTSESYLTSRKFSLPLPPQQQQQNQQQEIGSATINENSYTSAAAAVAASSLMHEVIPIRKLLVTNNQLVSSAIRSWDVSSPSPSSSTPLLSSSPQTIRSLQQKEIMDDLDKKIKTVSLDENKEISSSNSVTRRLKRSNVHLNTNYHTRNESLLKNKFDDDEDNEDDRMDLDYIEDDLLGYHQLQGQQQEKNHTAAITNSNEDDDHIQNINDYGLRKRHKKNDYLILSNGNSAPISQRASSSPLLLADSPTMNESSSSSICSSKPWFQDETLYHNIIKTSTAILKVITCTFPCLPYSSKPLILYPVILLATLDFWSEKISHSLLLLAIHLLWLGLIALFTGGMCMNQY
ncbi:unnamed protein product [Cunninghamella blakesleeana]